MKRKNTISLLFAVVLLTALVAGQEAVIPTDSPGLLQSHPQPNTQRPDAREVVVRLYNNWWKDPATFQKISVQLTGHSIRLDSNDINEPGVVVVVGGDPPSV